jgi:putative Mn2+ efflux pump MntP
MDTLLQELIEFVKNASPTLWAIYVKQSYVEGIGSLAFFVVLLVVGVIVVKIGLKVKKQKELEDSYDDNSFHWFLISIGITLVGASIVVFFSSIGYFINPEYQAIQLIIETLK